MTTPTRTSRADVNRLSCSNGIWGLDEGSDHAQTLGSDWIAPAQVNAYLAVDGTQYDALLKICDGSVGPDYCGTPLVIPQGRENCVDLNNRVGAVRIKAEYGAAGQVGDQVITVKGGCSGVWFMGTIHSSGRNGHVVVGAWSDQCHDISTNLDFTGLTNADGKPLTFVLARCKGVKLPPGARVLRLKSLSYSAYWWLKFAYVKITRKG